MADLKENKMKKKRKERKDLPTSSSTASPKSMQSATSPGHNSDGHSSRSKGSSSNSSSSGSGSNRNGELPVDMVAKEIVATILSHKTTIIVGETGCGKSTRLPQHLLKELRRQQGTRKPHLEDSGSKDKFISIVCTQPRRVAAVTIAGRVSKEMRCTLGQQVGYTVRFDDKSCHSTQLKYVTDGVLLREAMSDPDLSRYNMIMLDESHERSLQTDILMGLIKTLQMKRSGLKVIIMSATLDVDLFRSFFSDVAIVKVPGRQYPVQAFYLRSPEPDFINAALLSCLQIHEQDDHITDGGISVNRRHETDKGHVLVFLPGREEIEGLQLLLEDALPSVNNTSSTLLQDFEIRPLYAAMSPEEQLRVFEPSPPGVRRFILATNIAETSVTLTGIRYVVDTGYAKTRWIQSSTGMEMLKTMPISKSQSNQRAGRAGRVGPGYVYRLYTESAFETLQEQSVPEIQRVSMAQVVLSLLALGVKEVTDFPFLSPPSESVLKKALYSLFTFGAINREKEITEHGRAMAALPLDPQYSHMLLKSAEYGCTKEILTAVAVLSSESVYLHPSNEEKKRVAFQAHRVFYAKNGDISTLCNIYDAWLKANRLQGWANANFMNQKSLQHAYHVRNQLEQLLKSSHHLKIDVSASCAPEQEPFLKCIAAGLFLQVARRNDGDVSKFTEGDDDISKSTEGLFKVDSSSFRFLDTSERTLAPFKLYRTGEPVQIHPSSCLFHTLRTALSNHGANDEGRQRNPFQSKKQNSKKKQLPSCVVYAELLVTSKRYLRGITIIDENWLPEIAPQMFRTITKS